MTALPSLEMVAQAMSLWYHVQCQMPMCTQRDGTVSRHRSREDVCRHLITAAMCLLLRDEMCSRRFLAETCQHLLDAVRNLFRTLVMYLMVTSFLMEMCILQINSRRALPTLAEASVSHLRHRMVDGLAALVVYLVAAAVLLSNTTHKRPPFRSNHQLPTTMVVVSRRPETILRSTHKAQ